MARPSLRSPAVGARVTLGIYVTGILAALTAAFYAGETGDWRPLFAVAVALTLVVLFVDGE